MLYVSISYSHFFGIYTYVAQTAFIVVLSSFSRHLIPLTETMYPNVMLSAVGLIDVAVRCRRFHCITRQQNITYVGQQAYDSGITR